MLGYRGCWDGGRGLGGKFQARVNSLELRSAERQHPNFPPLVPALAGTQRSQRVPGEKRFRVATAAGRRPGRLEKGCAGHCAAGGWGGVPSPSCSTTVGKVFPGLWQSRRDRRGAAAPAWVPGAHRASCVTANSSCLVPPPCNTIPRHHKLMGDKQVRGCPRLLPCEGNLAINATAFSRAEPQPGRAPRAPCRNPVEPRPRRELQSSFSSVPCHSLQLV